MPLSVLRRLFLGLITKKLNQPVFHRQSQNQRCRCGPLPRPPNTAAAQLFVPAAVAAIANASAVAVDRTSARLFCAIEQSFPDDDGNSLENFQGGCDDRALILGAVGFSAKGETQ